MFRTIFGKIEILVFLYPKIPKNQFLGLEISIWGRSPAKLAEIWKKQYVNFFQKKILPLMDIHFWYILIFVKIGQTSKKRHFHIFCKIPFYSLKGTKFENFWKVQILGFQKSIWSLGLFPAKKKLFPFEIPTYHCYSPLFWIYIWFLLIIFQKI